MSNFHPLEVVNRGSETQPQVVENLNKLSQQNKSSLCIYRVRMRKSFTALAYLEEENALKKGKQTYKYGRGTTIAFSQIG